jgi:hypothetical protein
MGGANDTHQLQVMKVMDIAALRPSCESLTKSPGKIPLPEA